MVKISMFMLCDALSLVKSQMTLISPKPILRPHFIPGNFSFSLCIGMSGIRPTTQTKIGFYITDPHGDVVHKFYSIPFEKDAKEEDIPLEAQSIMLAMDIRNIPVKLEGEYKFVLYVDGQEADSHGFYIYKKSDS